MILSYTLVIMRPETIDYCHSIFALTNLVCTLSVIGDYVNYYIQFVIWATKSRRLPIIMHVLPYRG